MSAAASPNAPACPTLQMLMVAVNQQRELKSQGCFRAGQEGATCEGPVEVHCVWCGVGAHAQCAALQPDKVNSLSSDAFVELQQGLACAAC